MSLKGGLTKMGSQFISKKKVMQIGHSKAITLPPIWLKANEVEAGDCVVVEALPDKLIISVNE